MSVGRRRGGVEICTGPLLLNIFRFAVPIMLSGLLQTLFNSVDAAVVGRFGSATALVLSLAGAVLSFLVLLLFDGGRSRRIGEIGVSVLSAFAHITGQCLAASLFYGFLAVLSFYPILTALSVPSGIFTGLLLLLILRSAEKLSQKGKGTP